jgi:hypothetical protein
MKMYTLSDVAELMAGENKKGYANHLFHLKLIWNDLLRRTLWVYNSVWLNTNKGNPYPYVLLPENTDTFIGLFYEEETCNKLVEVLPASGYSLRPKPTKKTCGCKEVSCNCGECCSVAHVVNYSTKPHVIDGSTFYEKIWSELCPNGDIVQYREVPTKSFFDNGYSIVYQPDQQRLCSVTVKPCGCVEETKENALLLAEHCGCTVTCNGDIVGVKHSETRWQADGRKMYLVGGTVRDWYRCDLIESDACDHSAVPEYALRCLMAGADWSKNQFNERIHPNIIAAKEQTYGRMKTKLLMDLNPIDLDGLNRLSDDLPKF